MTRLFLEDGESVPVTAVSVCGNFLADIKTSERDGYNAFVVSKPYFIAFNRLVLKSSVFFNLSVVNAKTTLFSASTFKLVGA